MSIKDYVLNVLKDYQKAHNNVPFKDFFYARYLKDNGRLN